MYSLFIECLPEAVGGAASLCVPSRGVGVLGQPQLQGHPRGPFAAALDRVCPFVDHEQSKQLSKRLVSKERLWIGLELCKLLGEGSLSCEWSRYSTLVSLR